MFNLGTFLLQLVFFFVFVGICVKFIWPPAINAMRERQQRIAEGLENAEKADAALAESQQEAEKILQQARAEGQQIIDQARKQVSSMIEDAKTEARSEGERILEAARAEVAQESNRAREILRNDVATLAVVGAERILSVDIDRSKHSAMLEELVQEL
ncbi:MAG: F0F1 ATP synthase subunit B [Gammaproteobacteria bacterium]|nr:F0F1 ATP synthase subunit B [Gammaproteobacteria bacterium]